MVHRSDVRGGAVVVTVPELPASVEWPAIVALGCARGGIVRSQSRKLALVRSVFQTEFDAARSHSGFAVSTGRTPACELRNQARPRPITARPSAARAITAHRLPRLDPSRPDRSGTPGTRRRRNGRERCVSRQSSRRFCSSSFAEKFVGVVAMVDAWSSGGIYVGWRDPGRTTGGW